ncbi:IS630 family transposase [Ktedonobacter racemifer]|uniref:IS630 family transposase n=1 Tax=Ktedonobacter racemifer TaxID=363277 RepID=UPI000A2F0B94|nr:IS630 family transposase [Ktedonobacter racemifer]
MSTYRYHYPVRLSKEQRRWLETMVHTSRTSTKQYLVARVLLMSDQSQGQPEATDGQIAEALSISRRTVIRIKQRFVQGNLQVALTGSFPRERPERRCLDGKGEAHLIHLACSQAPDGRQRWTLELLANQMVRLEYVEHISPETVRKTLKKTKLKPWLKKSWCFPKEADGNFVYHMEDVLDVYCQPYDPAVPRICMDEMGKNLVKDKYPPEPAKPGQVTREDYTYEKEGRANLFIAYEPLAGKRCLKVTEHRTKQDWALFMREVLEEQYPEASKVVVVLDNLNTHTHASFYEVFPPAQAKALIDRLEIHYTPKHASWLNIAEIELSVLARQGLAHNIATIEELCRQVETWQAHRNQRVGTVNWQFRTADARIKLKRLYPVQQPDGL